MSLLAIDGSILEGGGQILRMSLAFSAITKTPLKIDKIRDGRSKPGLREQHLKGLQLLQLMCQAKITNAKLGSTLIEFWPQELISGTFKSVIKTAGSVSLLAQVSLPCAIFSKNETVLHLFGGTNCEMAPQIEHTIDVLRNVLKKFEIEFHCEVVKRGYFPKGGGEVMFTIKPVDYIKPLVLLDFGIVRSISGSCFVAGPIPSHIVNTMATSAINYLGNVFKHIQINKYRDSSNTTNDKAYGISLVAETSTGCFLGGSALGRKNESPEDTAKRACQELINSIQAEICVDNYIQDQIIIYMALAKGPSKIRVGEITLHTKSAMFIAEMFTNAKFQVTKDGSTNIIHCTGIK